MRIAQPRHRQRLQVSRVGIVGKLLDRFARSFEQREHVAASKGVVEFPPNLGVDQIHQCFERWKIMASLSPNFSGCRNGQRDTRVSGA